MYVHSMPYIHVSVMYIIHVHVYNYLAKFLFQFKCSNRILQYHTISPGDSTQEVSV